MTMNAPNGTLNSPAAITSRSLNSQNLRPDGHGHCRQPSFWSAMTS